MSADDVALHRIGRRTAATLERQARAYQTTLTLERIVAAAGTETDRPAASAPAQRPGRGRTASRVAAAAIVATAGIAGVARLGDREVPGGPASPASTLPDAAIAGHIGTAAPAELAILDPAPAGATAHRTNPVATWFLNGSDTQTDWNGRTFAEFAGAELATSVIVVAEVSQKYVLPEFDTLMRAEVDGVDARIVSASSPYQIAWTAGTTFTRLEGRGAVGLDTLADYAQAVVDAGSFRDAPTPDGFEEVERPDELGTVTYTGDQVSVTLLDGDRRSAAFEMPLGPPEDESVPEPLAGDRGWLLDRPDGSIAVVWLAADRYAIVRSIGEPLSTDIAASVHIVPGESVEEGPLAAALSQRFGGIPADASLVAAGDATAGRFLAVTFPGAADRTCVAVAINADGGIVVPQDCGTGGELLAACWRELPNGSHFWVWVQGDVEAVDVTVNGQPVQADIEYVAGFAFTSVRSADASDDLVVTFDAQPLCRG